MKGHNDRVVIIDASPSGVSGDKFLGALVDLGGKPETLKRVAKTVSENLAGTESIDVKVRRVERGEIGAQLVMVESRENVSKRKGNAVLAAAKKSAAKLSLSDWASRFSLSTLETLLEAESKVHGHSRGEVELHELGSADTLVDVLGVASLVESQDLASAGWWLSPITVGGGTIQFSSRSYPNPPPAVAEILRKHHVPTERGLVNRELSTPTGVAIAVNLATMNSQSYPSIRPERIGYGAGSKDLDEVANALRLTVGRSLGGVPSHDEIVILETNVDDVSGEVIGHAVERLMSQGARDVTVTPVMMKKNRPGHIISIISSVGKAEELAAILSEETGTLGVREIPVRRHIADREITKVEFKVGDRTRTVRVKVSRTNDGRVLRAKPEFEDLQRLARQTGLSLRSLASKAERAAEDTLSASRS